MMPDACVALMHDCQLLPKRSDKLSTLITAVISIFANDHLQFIAMALCCCLLIAACDLTNALTAGCGRPHRRGVARQLQQLRHHAGNRLKGQDRHNLVAAVRAAAARSRRSAPWQSGLRRGLGAAGAGVRGGGGGSAAASPPGASPCLRGQGWCGPGRWEGGGGRGARGGARRTAAAGGAGAGGSCRAASCAGAGALGAYPRVAGPQGRAQGLGGFRDSQASCHAFTNNYFHLLRLPFPCPDFLP